MCEQPRRLGCRFVGYLPVLFLLGWRTLPLLPWPGTAMGSVAPNNVQRFPGWVEQLPWGLWLPHPAQPGCAAGPSPGLISVGLEQVSWS